MSDDFVKSAFNSKPLHFLETKYTSSIKRSPNCVYENNITCLADDVSPVIIQRHIDINAAFNVCFASNDLCLPKFYAIPELQKM